MLRVPLSLPNNPEETTFRRLLSLSLHTSRGDLNGTLKQSRLGSEECPRNFTNLLKLLKRSLKKIFVVLKKEKKNVLESILNQN